MPEIRYTPEEVERLLFKLYGDMTDELHKMQQHTDAMLTGKKVSHIYQINKHLQKTFGDAPKRMVKEASHRAIR
jgi:hypothetical protein